MVPSLGSSSSSSSSLNSSLNSSLSSNHRLRGANSNMSITHVDKFYDDLFGRVEKVSASVLKIIQDSFFRPHRRLNEKENDIPKMGSRQEECMDELGHFTTFFETFDYHDKHYQLFNMNKIAERKGIGTNEIYTFPYNAPNQLGFVGKDIDGYEMDGINNVTVTISNCKKENDKSVLSLSRVVIEENEIGKGTDDVHDDYQGMYFIETKLDEMCYFDNRFKGRDSLVIETSPISFNDDEVKLQFNLIKNRGFFSSCEFNHTLVYFMLGALSLIVLNCLPIKKVAKLAYKLCRGVTNNVVRCYSNRRYTGLEEGNSNENDGNGSGRRTGIRMSRITTTTNSTSGSVVSPAVVALELSEKTADGSEED